MIIYNNKTLIIPSGLGTVDGGASDEQIQQAFQSGVTYQKSLLTSTEITENGDYSRENGYNNISVNVPSKYDEGYDNGYDDGFDDGVDSGYTRGRREQKELLVSTAITENGTFSRDDGWNSITVNVPQTGDMQEAYNSGITHQKSLLVSTAITENGSYSREDGYSSITVNVPQTGYTQQDLDAAYQRGWNDAKQEEQDTYSTEYLTIEALENGTLYWKTNSSAFTKTIEFSKNDGTWTSVTSSSGNSGTTVTTVVAGDKVRLRGNNSWYCDTIKQTYFATDFEFNVYGNIMSLIYGNDFENQTVITDKHSLCSIFVNCNKLINAENLILPATTLVEHCYDAMFYGCTSLTTAPVLPATTLAFGCYKHMFNSCTSLTTAPELPATTLAESCYQYMFEGCRNLNYIKCLATTDVKVNNCASWVNGVSSTGTFVKKAGVNWSTGISGIPANWTVVEEQ